MCAFQLIGVVLPHLVFGQASHGCATAGSSPHEVELQQLDVQQLNDMHANCYKVQSDNNTFTACLPEIIVGGHAKCGTSALYKLLTLHPGVEGTAFKEYCINSADNTAAFLRKLPPVSTTRKRVSGCHNLEWNTVMFRVLLPRLPIKILFIVRDCADTMWAAYNFWCIENFDAKCCPGGWTDPESDYRSPELFHELLLAEKKTKVKRIRLRSPFINRFMFTPKIKAYEKLVGKHNVLVVDADSLEHDTLSTWHKIANFTGLSAHHPSLSLFQSRRYNAQDRFEHRGADTSKISANHVAGLYAASGYRPMLDHTRRMITEAWREDCTLLNQAYNLSLRACL